MPSKENPIKIPDIIPHRCNECKYFTEKKEFGFLDSYLGTCQFYDGIDMDPFSKCLAVTRYGKSPSIKCSNCSTVNNSEAIFCIQCGKEISPKELITIAYCDKCKSEYDESNKFCEKCGNQLEEREVEKKTEIKDHSSKLKKNEDKPFKSNNEELGFGWGQFWIVMGFLQGGIALVFFVIMGVQTPQLSNRGVGLLISILGIGSAYGIMQRKLFGLYLVYATLVLGIIGGLIGLVSGEEKFTILGVIAIVISIFWFIYFNKRKEMFS